MIAYRADGTCARLLLHMCMGAYNDEKLIQVVRDLRRHLRGAKATLLWDGLMSHRSRLMQGFLRTQRHWLVVERLPAYAPELNPVEGLWANLKGGELANRCEETIEATVAAVEVAVDRVRRHQQLLFAFVGQTGLSL